MSAQKESISEKFLALLNPAPVNADPEADIHEETTAKVVNKDLLDDQPSDDETLSLFRKQNTSLIEESDERYKGKKISRKHFAENICEEIGFDEVQSTEGSTTSEAENDVDSDAFSEVDTTSSEVSSGAGGEESRNDDDIDMQTDIDLSFQHISKQNVGAEVEKGTAIHNQLTLYDGLLECRIQLQKCLTGANRFPTINSLPEFMFQGGNTFSSAVKQINRSVADVLDKLLELRSEKLKLFSETRGIGREKSEIHQVGSDIITSSSEDDEVSMVEENAIPNSKKRKLSDYSSLLEKHHLEFVDYRNVTIQKWNDKTRVAMGKVNSRNFSAFEQSTVRQIEQTMMNRQRLIGRTQLKRSSYRILGKERIALEKPIEVLNMDTMEDKSKEYDMEIFDDNDFYHQLLRELIERKASDVTDPMKLGRQWLELQKARSKMKRKIDTKATKGRKVRYTQHAKLVNFMAPVAEVAWNNDARSELYNSLFGKL